jgi:hypothetical protein
MLPRSSALALVATLLVSGCGQKAQEHPPNANTDCDGGPGCAYIPPTTGGGGKDGGGVTDAAGDAAGSVSVGGTIVELTSDDFFTATAFTTPSTVRFEGASGVPVETQYNGTSFSIDGVLADLGVWATVTPSTAIALPTVQPVDTTTGQSVELAVVPGATIDLIYAVLTAATTRQAGAAHVVVHFIDSNGAGVQGVSVSHGSDIVAYDSGGSWSDLAQATGPAGFAVVVNVPTGSSAVKQSFTFTTATDSAGVELQLEPDSVTLANVLVQ